MADNTIISFFDLDEVQDEALRSDDPMIEDDTMNVEDDVVSVEEAVPEVPEEQELPVTDDCSEDAELTDSDPDDALADEAPIPWSHSYSYEDVDALCSLSPDRWSRDELTLCGQILADNDAALSDEIAILKGALVIDPGTVIRNISLRASRCSLAPAPEGPVNHALCEVVALAWCRNINYYMPLQRKDPDTILDFCHLCWEYLQTVHVPDVPSIEARLVMAARPNGWIGSRSVFMTAEQRNYRYRTVRAPRRSRRFQTGELSECSGSIPAYLMAADGPAVLPSRLSGDSDSDGSKPVPYVSMLVSTPYYTWEQVEDELDLEYVEEVLTKRYPHLHIGAYMMICAADDRLIKTPSAWDMDVARRFFRRQGIRVTPVLLRRWFRACYEAVRFAVRSGYVSPDEEAAAA